MVSQKHILKKSFIYKKVYREISEGSRYVFGKTVESTGKVFGAFFPFLTQVYSK